MTLFGNDRVAQVESGKGCLAERAERSQVNGTSSVSRPSRPS
jgi:hypothetical protein